MASKSSVKTILKVEKVPMAIQAISLVAEEVADDMYKHCLLYTSPSPRD